MLAFHALPAEEALKALNTEEQGLSEEEVQIRLRQYGLNRLPTKGEVNRFKLLLDQFKNPLILALVLAAVITFFLKELADTVFIVSAILLNTFLGFYQENKAENALQELETYIEERVRVIRNDKETEINAEEIVPGDIIRIVQGSRIPADARLLYANNIDASETILTGESLPVRKSITPVNFDTLVSDQKSMVFAGTVVVEGFGTAVVVATGKETQIGQIAELVKSLSEEETPLQRAVGKFSRRAGAAIAIITLGIFGLGVYLGEDTTSMFIIAVSIAVAAVPEGLPIALTVVLAIGVQRLAKRKGIVRRLLAAETLGDTTIIITDKTGTLTEAKMELSGVVTEVSNKEEMLSLAALTTDAIVENPEDSVKEWRIAGNPLEAAIIRAAGKNGLTPSYFKKMFAVIEKLPFEASRKFSASLVKSGQRYAISCLGAPETIIGLSELNEEARQKTLQRIDQLARNGELVLAIASRNVRAPKEINLQDDTRVIPKLNFLGLITFRDPVRATVKDSIRRVHGYGVRTVIATGDHQGTAESIAREIDFRLGEGSVISGDEFDKLTDEEMKIRLDLIKVFARVTPEQKLRIARLYQKQGEIVAMTGDGVNDAPALKEADVGIAVGSGTDVAKSVSDLIILDDNFETIVAAIEEGRNITANIRKVLVYLFSGVFNELVLVGGALILGIPLPLNALQILWVNFFSDSFPAIALAFDKHVDKMSDERPNLGKQLFDKEMRFLILVIGTATSVLLLILYLILLKFNVDPNLARTFIFACFGVYSLFVVFSIRGLRSSIREYNPFSNRYLVGGVVIGNILMLLAVYAPFFQTLFHTVPLPFPWFMGVAIFSVVNVAAIEFGKSLFIKKQ